MEKNIKIPVYWYNDKKNFGDRLNYYIFREQGIDIEHSSPQRAKIIGMGSILEHLPRNTNALILGSGCMYEDTRYEINPGNIILVRGKLTATRTNAHKNVLLGDPGLLVYKLNNEDIGKRYKVGLIPHFVDKYDERIIRLYKKYEDEILLINIQSNDIQNVLKMISSCYTILSTSLHGLIAGMSLGIPSGWIKLSNMVLGSGFKFYDFFSSFDFKYNELSLTGKESIQDLQDMCKQVPESIESVKDNIECAFQEAILKLTKDNQIKID